MSGGGGLRSVLSSRVQPPMPSSILTCVSPLLDCANAPMLGTQKQRAWNWKVCTQQEETGDTIK